MSSKNKEKSEFIRKISLILQNPMGEGDKEILHTLQGNMDELFLDKANGAFIRSRAKWLEFVDQTQIAFST